MENVAVTDHGSCYENLALSWEQDGARYHIWESNTDVLFKNPPLTIKPNEPGYFHARKLDPGAKANHAMILEARAIARKDDLYRKAAIAKEEKAHAEKMAQLGAIHARRKHDAGEMLYDACKRAIVFLNLFEEISEQAFGDWSGVRDQLQGAIDKADNG